MRDTLFGNVLQEPWPFDRPSYLGSKLAMCVNSSAKQLSRQRGTQARLHSRSSPARYSFRMTTHRNRSTPSGKWAPIPANMEAVREFPTRNREWPKRTNALVVGERPGESLRRFQGQRSGQVSVDVWGSSRKLLGDQRSESNRKRLSASKGTREAQPSMAITRIGRLATAESSPMRRLGGGASVVVRGRESRPHGEGRQDVSFWTAEAFGNREGSR
jgi:hypothetical protein